MKRHQREHLERARRSQLSRARDAGRRADRDRLDLMVELRHDDVVSKRDLEDAYAKGLAEAKGGVRYGLARAGEGTVGFYGGPFMQLDDALREVGDPGDELWELSGNERPDRKLYAWDDDTGWQPTMGVAEVAVDPRDPGGAAASELWNRFVRQRESAPGIEAERQAFLDVVGGFIRSCKRAVAGDGHRRCSCFKADCPECAPRFAQLVGEDGRLAPGLRLDPGLVHREGEAPELVKISVVHRLVDRGPGTDEHLDDGMPSVSEGEDEP